MPSLKKRGKKHHSVRCKKMFFICLGFYTLFQETSLSSSLGCSRNTSKIHVIKLIVVFSFYDVLWSRFEDQEFWTEAKMTELWQQWPNLGPFEMCQGWAGLGFLRGWAGRGCGAQGLPGTPEACLGQSGRRIKGAAVRHLIVAPALMVTSSFFVSFKLWHGSSLHSLHLLLTDPSSTSLPRTFQKDFQCTLHTSHLRISLPQPPVLKLHPSLL